MAVKKVAVFAGSFDPITNGHLSILKLALKDFNQVILLLAVNPKKRAYFTSKKRLAMMKAAVKDLDRVKVDYTKGYTVNYARSHHAEFLIRGVRNKTDQQYENKLAKINQKLAPEIKTIIYPCEACHKNLSSTKIKQLIKNGSDLTQFLPHSVIKLI
ncbi:MAG: pantetheine-phosphate adenylyltransferase [Bacilli bacterium]|nr:pantetheine-phosphate adenylyltransferase [Bacilli bacterium]